MRILQICKKVPWPLHDGEAIAVYGIAKGLIEQGHIVELLCMNTSKHQKSRNVKGIEKIYESVTIVDVDNGLSLTRLLQNLFLSNDPIHVDRLRSYEFADTLEKKLFENTYDVILMETVYASLYSTILNTQSHAQRVIRCHNVEHLIWQRLCPFLPFWERWYYVLQAKRVKSFEKNELVKASLILPLSSQDEQVLKTLCPSVKSKVIPIALDLRRYQRPSVVSSDKLKLCFIGSLDWQPNLHGLSWFLDKVWPEVLKSEKDKTVELHIAGKNMPKSLMRQNRKGVVIHGEVKDAIDFINDHDAMIVPLFAGSGQRVKILEAMALGKSVLSTKIGIEGIGALDGVHYVKCINEASFTSSILKFWDNESRLSSEKVKNFVRDGHDMEKSAIKSSNILMNGV